MDTDLPWQFNLLCKTFDTLRVWSEKKYRIFFHNVPTLVGIFIILKDLFEFKKRSQKGRNNKYHLFNGGNIRENFICENITHFLETELILKCMYLTETKIIHLEEAKNLL